MHYNKATTVSLQYHYDPSPLTLAEKQTEIQESGFQVVG